MGKYTQNHRAMAVTTPLGPDVLLLERFSGTEAVSELFRFQLDLLAERSDAIPFEQLLAQPVTVEFRLPGGPRYVNGIVSHFSQGEEFLGPAGEDFVRYQAEVVPRLWLLTRRVQSRVFQHQSVPDVLRAVLAGLDVAFQLTGHYDARDYVVQYQESDFAFASRLMEDEGLFYFFTHTADGHRLVIADAPAAHPALEPDEDVVYELARGGPRPAGRVLAWAKHQEVRADRYTLWDHCFQLADQSRADHLQATAAVRAAVTVGTVRHPLAAGVDGGLEVFEYPGGYADRYDDVDAHGAPQPAALGKVFEDNLRTARLRMDQEAARAVWAEGRSTCARFAAGARFTLRRHFNADGPYVLSRVEHSASLEGGYTTGATEAPFLYENRFACLPFDLPYRPARRTPRPVLAGTQTATVVGPEGQELFVDQYGRVKVQFHWDRQGRYNADSSCWVRVGQVWAGKRWGAFFWPRAGQEVLVAFEEGNPDRPVIVGSVYNSTNLPPFELPGGATASGIKSASVGGDPLRDYNWLVFHDAPDDEHIHLHSENHELITSESSRTRHTPGPYIHVSGYLPFGGGSGGGGGGPAGSFQVGSGGGGGMLDVLDLWGTIAGEDQPGWLANFGALFPGSASYVAGNYIGSVLLGDQVYHTLGGAAVNLVVDPEAIVEEAVSPGLALALRTLLFGAALAGEAADMVKHGSKLSAGQLAGMIAGGLGTALLPGVGGGFTMTVGPNTGLTYSGPNLSVTRGHSLDFKTADFWSDTSLVGLGSKALIFLIAAGATAADIAGRVFTVSENAGGLEWASLCTRAFVQRLMGLLRLLEEYNAKATEAANKAAEAVAMAKEITKLVTSADPNLIKMTEAITEAAEDRLKVSLNLVVQVLDQVKATATQGLATAQAALPYTGRNINTDFSLTACNVSFISDTSRPEVQAPRNGTPSDINLTARGSGNDGAIRMTATRQIWAGVANGGMGLSLQSGVTGNLAALTNTLNGVTSITQGTFVAGKAQILLKTMPPTLDMICGLTAARTTVGMTATALTLTAPAAGGSITLSAGPTCSITMSPTDGITLTFGAWSLVLNNTGITLSSAQSSVQVTPQGLQFSGLNLNHTATLQSVFNAVKVQESVQALVQMLSALLQNQ